MAVGDSVISLPTGKTATVMADFETLPQNVSVESHSKISINENAAYAMQGKSAKITLNGYIGLLGDTSLRPYIHVDAFGGDLKLTDTERIEFYVYNDSDEYVETSLYVQVTENKVKTNSVYDKYLLAPKAWTKIEIDNAQVLGWRENRLKMITGFGLSFANPIKDGKASSITLYLDEISYRRA